MSGVGINYIEIWLALAVFAYAAVHFLFNYTRKEKILLSDLYIWIAALTFGLGPLISFVLGYRYFPEFSSPLLLTYLSVFLFFIGLSISKVLCARFLFGAPGLTRSGTRSPVFFFIDHCREIPASNIVLIFAVVFGLQMYSFSLGGGISGLNTLDVNLEKSYLVVIMEHIARPFQHVLYFFCFYTLFKKQRNLWIITLPILGFLAFDAFLSGRRSMMFFVLFGAITVFAVHRKIKVRHVLAAGLAAVLIVGVISPFFLSFRSASQNLKQTMVDNSLTNVVTTAIEDTAASEQATLMEKGVTNLKGRFLLLRSFPMLIFEAQENRAPLMGRAFIHSLSSGLPRAFRPFESWINPQNYIQYQYGMAVSDVANSVPALFIADFWLPGALIGGIFFGLYLNFGTYIAYRVFRHYPLAGMAVFASLFILALNTENNPTFLLTVPRNLILTILMFWALKQVGLRIHTPGEPEMQIVPLGPPRRHAHRY